MARLEGSQDPVFKALNSSIGFDWRLAPYDIAQSKAHAKMLAKCGVISDDECEELVDGLDKVGNELEENEFIFDADDEDIHMAVERRLTEIVGSVGGKLHTARSRNDQVVTDLAMFVRGHAQTALERQSELMAALLACADENSDAVLPGYTHLQRAQPVYLTHHLLAYFWMFTRDSRRMRACMQSASRLPLGSGALAGVNWETDREFLAKELGFDSVSENSMDAVASRDFVIEYLAAAATCATNLSRLGAEIVLWSSEEFGFCEVEDDFASTSSIMPQKKNPDAAELLRAKAPRIVGNLTALYGVLHGLPLTYNKDLQEDKEGLFDSVDTLEICLEAAAEMLRNISFNDSVMAEASADEFLAATDLADLLAKRGVPFREAHNIVGTLVRSAIDQGKKLSEFDLDTLKKHSQHFDDEYYLVLGAKSGVESKVSAGGTAKKRVSEQISLAWEELSRHKQ